MKKEEKRKQRFIAVFFPSLPGRICAIVFLLLFYALLAIGYIRVIRSQPHQKKAFSPFFIFIGKEIFKDLIS